MIRSLSIFLFCFPATLLAQFNYKLSSDVSVQQGDLTLNAPWTGGLNAPQFNTMDINNDGLEDLILYDRTSSLVLPYLQQDGKYSYAPDYAVYFSVEIENWLILRDYNCDGVKDLFTGDILGIRVYTNQAEPGEAPVWDQFIFYTDKGKSNVLLSKGSTFKNNVNLQYDDLPAFVDADGDGDLDLFNMIYSAGNTIEFHKNFSMERYGVCDSLDFERQTQKWGGVSECVCGTFAFNNEDCPMGGRTLHAGGKSLTAIDADGNGLMDLLISEANCNRIFLLRNEGDFENPVVTEASVFPEGSGVDILPYPSAYYEDVDFDGVKDLIASPNIYSRAYSETDLENSVWYYKNTGTTAVPVFSFVQRDFLQQNMLDVGDNAVPVLVDLDNDGDVDLLVSRNTSNLNVATVLLYENFGDDEVPIFKLVDEVHKRGMKIIIDGVFNHVGTEFWAFKDLAEKGKNSKYADWFIVKSFDDPSTKENEFDYKGWWNVRGMPEFNRTKENLLEEPKQHIFAITKKWMDPNSDGNYSDGIDGWRLDVARDVPLGFWREWRKVVKGINPNAYIVGELWELSDDFVAKGDAFDALMNYNFAFAVNDFFIANKKRISVSAFVDSLKIIDKTYPEQNLHILQNLVTSHDTERLVSMIINPDRRYDRDSDERNPNYNPRKPNEEEYNMQKMIAAFQMTYRGAPMIYYGDEVGMWGADDPHDRQPMIWEELKYDDQIIDSTTGFKLGHGKYSVEINNDVLNFYKKIIDIRKNSDALKKGKSEFIYTNDAKTSFAFKRIFNNGIGEEVVIAAFNLGNEKDSFKIFTEGKVKELIEEKEFKGNKNFQIEIPAKSVRIYKYNFYHK